MIKLIFYLASKVSLGTVWLATMGGQRLPSVASHNLVFCHYKFLPSNVGSFRLVFIYVATFAQSLCCKPVGKKRKECTVCMHDWWLTAVGSSHKNACCSHQCRMLRGVPMALDMHCLKTCDVSSWLMLLVSFQSLSQRIWNHQAQLVALLPKC